MNFIDIHCHLLWGVDDGANSPVAMRCMLDQAWANGIRTICATPHFGIRQLHQPQEAVQIAFAQLCDYASQQKPDMRLFLGNELRYHESCIDWLESGKCRTLNGTKYVLVDFSAGEERDVILDGLLTLLNAGYHPVFAHAERYASLNWNLDQFRFLKDKGVLLQIDGDSLYGGWGLRARYISRALVKKKLADLVCSDAHGFISRPPELKRAYAYITKTAGENYAAWMNQNAAKCLNLSR